MHARLRVPVNKLSALHPLLMSDPRASPLNMQQVAPADGLDAVSSSSVDVSALGGAGSTADASSSTSSTSLVYRSSLSSSRGDGADTSEDAGSVSTSSPISSSEEASSAAGGLQGDAGGMRQLPWGLGKVFQGDAEGMPQVPWGWGKIFQVGTCIYSWCVRPLTDIAAEHQP